MTLNKQSFLHVNAHIWNIPAQIPLCRPQSDIPVDSTASTNEARKKCRKRMVLRQKKYDYILKRAETFMVEEVSASLFLTVTY